MKYAAKELTAFVSYAQMRHSRYASFQGCQEVQNILHARVPIIKYQQQLLGLECDLSVTSL